jgi:hypothetical protein
MARLDPRIDTALRSIDPSGMRPAWHGAPTLLGVLRGVSAETALWRPVPEQRCIWELALHVAFWENSVACRLSGETPRFRRRSPVISGWCELPDPADDRAWKADVRLVRETHARLVEMVAAFDPKRLDRPAPGTKNRTAITLMHGVAEHDLWHTAQIRLLKRLATRPRGS